MIAEQGAMAVLLAERAITRLLHEFNDLNDSGAYEALVALFTPDGRFARPTDPDRPLVGREAILAAFKSRPPRLTRHMVSNIRIDLEGLDAARARSHVVLYTCPAPDTPVSILVGGFVDHLVRLDGQWLFASRQGSLAMKGTLVP